MQIKYLPKNGRLSKLELARLQSHFQNMEDFAKWIFMKGYYKRFFDRSPRKIRIACDEQLKHACSMMAETRRKAVRNMYYSEKKFKDAHIELLKFYSYVFDGDAKRYEKALKAWRSRNDKLFAKPTRKDISLMEKAGLERFDGCEYIGDGVANRCYQNSWHFARKGVVQYMGYILAGGMIFGHGWNVKDGKVIEHTPLTKKALGSRIVYYGIPFSDTKFPDAINRILNLKIEAKKKI